MIVDQIFHKVFCPLKVTQPLLCSCFNLVYMFKSLQCICQFISLDICIISDRNPLLSRGKSIPRFHYGKFLKICHFLLWVKQFPSGYWQCVKNVLIRSFSGPYFAHLDSIRRDTNAGMRIRENTDQKYSDYGHFSRSVRQSIYKVYLQILVSIELHWVFQRPTLWNLPLWENSF